ncbi:MAG TPA: hypothetical protein VKQ71_07145, partial [Acidimicrobiales bacterium]|nr:hypothetical protein [Acidimicrobiales bacterium]
MTPGNGTAAAPIAPRSVYVLTAGLGAAAVAMTVVASAAPDAPRAASKWAIVPLLVPLILAGLLRVRFHYRGHVEAIDLLETMMAPALLLFPAWLVVSAVAASKGVAQIVVHIHPLKAVFNIVQWAAAAAVGCIIVTAVGPGGSIGRRLLVVGTALVAVIVVNHTAVTVVLVLATRRALREVVTGLAPVISSGWTAAGLLNLASGMLLASAAAESAWVTPLAVAPLAGLYLAGRHLVVARLDRDRRADFRRATQALADDPIGSRQALGSFLAAVADCFSAEGAEVMVEHGQWVEIFSVDAGPERSISNRNIERFDGRALDALVEALLALDDTSWIQAR